MTDTFVDSAAETRCWAPLMTGDRRLCLPEWLFGFPPGIDAADPDVFQHVIGEAGQGPALASALPPWDDGIDDRYPGPRRWVGSLAMTSGAQGAITLYQGASE
jgi:hypothetical protein